MMPVLTDSGNSTYAVKNPRNGETLYTVAEPSPEQIDMVFEKARCAAAHLRKTTVAQRLGALEKLQHCLLKHREHIVKRICEETGKCPTDALLAEVYPALDIIEYYKKHGERLLADKKVPTPLLMFGKKSRVIFEPLGVVLIISPWNYPFNLSFLPWVCAFTAGNAAIIKPSKETPLKGVYEELLDASGFSPDALQIVYASRKTADLLIDKKPDKIHFTGSVEAGKKVMARAAQSLIPVELELGGKDPMIVFADANIERAVNGALWGSFFNSGQTCTSVERIYVEHSIYDSFITLFKEKTERLVALDKGLTDQEEASRNIGCMTTEFQSQEIESQLESALEAGAKIVTGGKRAPKSPFMPPTIVSCVSPDMRLQREETFGPVVTITPFGDEDEAVHLANDSPYGLSASVWSGDIQRARRIARRLVTGNVSINNVLATQANPALPFGGIKESGFGRYKGEWGLHAFSNIKSVLEDKNSNQLEPYWYPYSIKKYNLFVATMNALFKKGSLKMFKVLLNGIKLEFLSKTNRL